MRIRFTRFIFPIALIGIIGIIFIWPRSAEAQCGTSASSCKNCHEVQAQDPVNTKGDWHVQHAFGDFCEFCHAGNVTATEKDAAHTAMIYPLSDPKGSCSSCHANDYQDLAGQYASTLGVDLNSVSAPAPSEPDTVSPTQDASIVQPDVTQEASSSAPAEQTSSGQIVDFNDRYDEFVSANAPRKPINTGNMILSFMVVGLVGTFGVLAWKFEGFDKRWAQLRGTAKTPLTKRSGIDSTGSTAIDTLLPTLEKASPATLAALNRLLETDPVRGGDLIEAVARLDPRLVEVVRRSSKPDLDLLVALVREMNERS